MRNASILAIDLGTHLGYARRTRGVTISGTVSFAPKARDGRGRRWANFRAWIEAVARDAALDAVYVEDLIVIAGGKHGIAPIVVFGGFMAHLEHWCEVNRLPLHVVHLTAIKRHWTGRGDAKKVDMVVECKRRGLAPVDDNEADALALLDYALCHQGEPTPTALELHASTPRAETWVDPFLEPVVAAVPRGLE